MKGHVCSFSLRGAPPRTDPTVYRSPKRSSGRPTSGTHHGSATTTPLDRAGVPSTKARRVLPPGIRREACSACGRFFTCIFKCICKEVASWFTQCTAYGAKILPKTQAERDLLDLKGKFGRSSAEALDIVRSGKIDGWQAVLDD